MRRTIAVVLFASSVALATTTIGEQGPPASLRKSVDQHLVDVYVTPPRSSANYKPGVVKVYLTRMYPEHLMVELLQNSVSNGRIRVHFAISPEKESSYFIRVSDLQRNGKYILLNEDRLSEIHPVTDK